MDEMLTPEMETKEEEVKKIELGTIGKLEVAESLKAAIMDLHCKFYEGFLIHSTLSTRFRCDKNDNFFNGTLRGLASCHGFEAEEYFENFMHLEKIAIDYHDIELMICKDDIKYLEIFKKDMTLEEAIEKWSSWEKTVLKCITTVLKELTCGKLYEFLIDVYKKVESELLYIKIMYRKMKLLEFEFENITWVDRKLHKYFEHEHKKHCRIDFDI